MILSRQSSLLVASSLSLLGFLAGTSPAAGSSRSPTSTTAPRQCGRMLFQRHCAPCHGSTGLGDGPAAERLDPKPRDFSTGRFRLISTTNEVPTTEDLFQVITNGIVGSAMPPHDQLPADQRMRLAAYVQNLARTLKAEALQAMAAEDGEELPWTEAVEEASVEPGPVVGLPEPIASTPELLSEGRELYVQNCATCHDPDGTGRLREDMVDEKGRPSFARDLTAGILKGGASALDIFRRIRCGMPGSPMPSFYLSDRETWALTRYVESLIRPGAYEAAVQRHGTFRLQAVSGSLDADPTDPIWNEVETSWLPMAPLQWSADRITGARIQTATNGDTLGFRLTWEDPSPQMAGAPSSPDSVVIRFSGGTAPSFFDPGRTAETSEIWEWRSDSGNFRYEPLGVEARASHENGHWELVFLRDARIAPERVGMGASPVSFALEIGNGPATDPNRAQNLTVWHRLER